MSAYALAVHTSLGFKKEDYFFRYKNREFRYIPGWKQNETDKVLTILRHDNNSEANEAYRLLAELLSVISFERDCKVILSSGVIAHGTHFDLEKVSGGYVERRSIPVSELSDEFYYIPPVRNSEQSDIVRIYREARSSSSLYLNILFYWHSLSYPHTKNAYAIEYVDRYLNHPSYLGDSIGRIVENPMMLRNKSDFVSFGHYVENAVRHSIAHFIRYPLSKEKGLDLDNFDQIQHLHDVRDVLKQASRNRIREE
ncbi:hypothetical protein G6N74_05380 [Mesorhizobium sp. CGMCC 1.15528]|uniref:Uncharacterized protein n=1 Tax=Mesorhizobium zhangyense TaxID=1776730 RepID=A0A7C9VA71_9HYPH|nr:methylamine utilization protein MauJ [Mesorhizobium zhangyense]NGN40489.1 hypothetical protein [Mesorhizobium zhangyense]